MARKTKSNRSLMDCVSPMSAKEIEKSEVRYEAERLVDRAYRETPEYKKAVTKTTKVLMSQKGAVKKIVRGK